MFSMESLQLLADKYNLYMDYKGQKNAELLMNIIVCVSLLIAFPLGYYKEMLSISLLTIMAGIGVAALITIPPWPLYRRNPLKWQKVKSDKEK